MGYDNGNSSAGEGQVFVIEVQRKEDENRLSIAYNREGNA